MSGAAAADPAPGARSGTWRTAELLCALSFGSGLAAAERMEHGTNTAFVGIQLGRALGLGADGLEAVFYGALLKDVGCGACGAVLAPFFADDARTPLLGMNLVDLHSPRSMATWAMGGMRLDPGLPARLTRLAAFVSRCGSLAHEAMTAHCEIAADFTVRLGFGRHVQDAVHYQHERYDGRSPAFHRRAEAIPRPAQILHLALAADLVRGLSGAGAAAAMVRQRAGSYFDPQVAEAYLDLDSGLWPPGDDPIPLADLAADVGTHHERLDGSGYPLGPAAQRLPVTARLLAAADVWAERARQGPPDLTGEGGLDPACLAALRSCTGRRRRRPRADPARPALSPRELEVLRLLADGASNPDISKTLYISRRTAEHHVEHILAKLEVTSRTAAVAHALTHELLS